MSFVGIVYYFEIVSVGEEKVLKAIKCWEVFEGVEFLVDSCPLVFV